MNLLPVILNRPHRLLAVCLSIILFGAPGLAQPPAAVTSPQQAEDKATEPADPNPERFADAIEAFLNEDAAEPPPGNAVVGVGSSSMRMWRDRIHTDLDPLAVIPRGFGGSQFSDLNHYFDTLVARYSPRAVMVYEGDNDISVGKSVERVMEDVHELAEKLQAMDPAPRVYLFSVKPSPARAHLWSNMKALNKRMKTFCEETPGFTYVDVASPLLTDDGEIDESCFVQDRVHLNEKGYDRWAAAVSAVVVPAEREFEARTK